MAKYHKRPSRREHSSSTTELDATESMALVSKYDRYRQTLMNLNDGEEWAPELRHYLKDRPADVSKDIDIIQWWQVSNSISIGFM